MDDRPQQLVDLVFDYSLKFTEGQVLHMRCEDTYSEFGELLLEGAKNRGGTAIESYFNLTELRALIERNNHKELEDLRDEKCAEAEQATSSVLVFGHSNPSYLQGVSPRKLKEFEEIFKRPLLDILVGDGKNHPGTRWNLFGIPTEANAKEAGMTFSQYEDFLYGATLNVDWPRVGEEMRAAKEIIDYAENVHIFVEGLTKIDFSLKDRGAEICDGIHNMPDGEFFYGPVEGSVNGEITFPYTSLFKGERVRGVKLVFEDGAAVIDKCKAEENTKYLREMLSIPGATVPGEFGIGTNNGITTPTGNILFDEKIAGTIHLTPGTSFVDLPLSSGGGKNKSALHWDLICELRKVNGNPGGQIYVDEKLVQNNGIWTF